MRKLSFLWVSALLGMLLVACSREEPVPLSGPESPAGISKVRSVDEALSELDAALDQLDASTRSGGRRTYSLANVAVAGGTASTRSAGAPALPDTLAYVVNFDHNEGFAVLGALREGTPVYAVTEQGTLDPGKLDEAIAEAYARLTKQEAAAAPETRSIPEAVQREIGIEIVPKLLAQALVAETLSSSSGGFAGWGNTLGDTYLRTEYSDWTLGTIVGPWVTTKWDQGYPFNMACDPLPASYVGDQYKELNGRCAVGCVILAVGQLTACTEHPRLIPSLPSSCTWSDLKSVSNYTNFASFDYRTVDNFFAANPAYKTKCGYLATYLHTLWAMRYCMAIPGASTASDIYKAKNALLELDYNYYKNATIVGMSFDPINIVNNLNEMYAMLDESKPVFVRGDSDKGGHAWLIDGYQDRNRLETKYYREKSGKIYTISWVQVNNLVHCNWGYQGYCDGYYEVGIFTMNPKQYRDELLDKEVPYDPRNDYYNGIDFSFDNKMIIY